MFRISTIGILFLFLFSSMSFAQGDLEIFGFAQAKIAKLTDKTNISANIPLPSGGFSEMVLSKGLGNYTSANIQQLNLFLRKELSGSFTSWVNLEFVNSYSSNKNWGSLNLEEAWVNYKYDDYLNIKAGLLTPEFNYLNTVKNRMPLLPYISRPIVYETTTRGLINPTDFLPMSGILQVSGNIPVSKFIFSYSAFVGSAEDDYVNSSDVKKILGNDTVNFKTYGGRLGFIYDELRLGVSAAFDKDNMRATLKEDVDRTKLGVDLGYSFYNFFIEAEYMKTLLDSKNSTADMDKMFYYALLGYNFSEKLFAYGMYNYLENESSIPLKDGLAAVNGGAGYRPIDSVVLKAEYVYTYNNNSIQLPYSATAAPAEGTSKIDMQTYSLAISILF